MRASARSLLREALAHTRPHTNRQPLEILDAGCGAGGGLRWLAEFGRVTGLDYHPKAVRLARRFSQRVVQASVLAVPFASGAFDVVTSFDVLYHRAVPDDGLALRELARVLRPGGWLLMRVPAHDQLRGAHDVQVHTRHRYARDELRAKLTGVGMDASRVTFAGALLLLPALVRRGRQRGAVASGQAHSDVVMPPPLVNELLGAGIRWESWWLRRWDLPAGLSLMALARKEA